MAPILKGPALDNKQYTSIVRLMEDVGFDYHTEVNLQRLKKLLLLGFSHSEDGFIQIDGFNYSKQDVLEELEQKDFLTRLPYHIKIWNSKSLLLLLEENKINDPISLRKQFNQFENDDYFDSFFTGYFRTAFVLCSRGLLKKQTPDFITLSTLFSFEDFLKNEDREEGFRPIKTYLEENLRLFANLHPVNFDHFGSEMHPWIYENWYLLFNMLPDELYQLKCDMVLGLINTAIKCSKRSISDSQAITLKLIQLTDLPNDLRESINNIRVIYDKPSGRNFATRSEFNPWQILWIVLIFIRLIAALNSCH